MQGWECSGLITYFQAAWRSIRASFSARKKIPPAAKAMNQAQLCHLFQEEGVWPDKAYSNIAFVVHAEGPNGNDVKNSAMMGIMTALRRLEDSTSPESVQTPYKAACLLEEATVSELAPILPLRTYSPSLHAAMSQFALQQVEMEEKVSQILIIWAISSRDLKRSLLVVLVVP